MDSAQFLVTLAGLAVIAGVLLFFFGPKRTAAAKRRAPSRKTEN